MDLFVNYKKRDVTLPEGCKNLVDVMAPSYAKEERFATGGLGHIERYVTMLLQQPKRFAMLRLTFYSPQISVWLHRRESQPVGEISVLGEPVEQEQTIRAFFEQRGIPPALDYIYLTSGTVLSYLLPPDAQRITKIATELLQGVYGVSDKTELELDLRFSKD